MAIANNIGLMARIQTTDGVNLWTSPTANLSFDLVLSFTIILMTHVEGIRRRGIKKYLKSICNTRFYDTNESLGRSYQSPFTCIAGLW